MERILQRIEGAGRVSAMITQGEDGAVTGAVIVAEGLSDVQTYLRVQRAVSALLNVEAAKIEIIGGGPLEVDYEQDGKWAPGRAGTGGAAGGGRAGHGDGLCATQVNRAESARPTAGSGATRWRPFDWSGSSFAPGRRLS